MKVIYNNILITNTYYFLLQGGLIEEVYSNQLVIALEPEAASLHCRTLSFGKFMSGGDPGTRPSFEPGTKYLVVDAGGNHV